MHFEMFLVSCQAMETAGFTTHFIFWCLQDTNERIWLSLYCHVKCLQLCNLTFGIGFATDHNSLNRSSSAEYINPCMYHSVPTLKPTFKPSNTVATEPSCLIRISFVNTKTGLKIEDKNEKTGAS
jgi:hypothetical protein